MIVVHHLNESRSQRILWLLEELCVPYEIAFYQRDARRRINRLTWNGFGQHVIAEADKPETVVVEDFRRRSAQQPMVLALGEKRQQSVNRNWVIVAKIHAPTGDQVF